MKKTFLSALLISSISTSATADIYTDELAKCLVASTTPADRVALVKWLFTAASAHPAVKDITAISNAQMNEANKTIGLLFNRLITDTCAEQMKNAVSYEGALAIQGGFEVLGQVAGQEMFSSPEVAANMAGLEQYIDKQKLEALVK